MRIDREELIRRFPSWKSNYDIVAQCYGDKPVTCWNESKYQAWCQLSGTAARIEAVEAYLYKTYGDFDIYGTLIGDVYVSAGGNVLCGNIRVMYGGKPHTILIDMTHGRNGLTVMRIGVKKVSIYRNSDGQGSPTLQKYTADMKEEVVNKVLNDPLKDYGVGIQKFMKTARKLWLSEMNFDAYDKDRVVA